MLVVSTTSNNARYEHQTLSITCSCIYYLTTCFGQILRSSSGIPLIHERKLWPVLSHFLTKGGEWKANRRIAGRVAVFGELITFTGETTTPQRVAPPVCSSVVFI
jgi:hypothetical protein